MSFSEFHFLRPLWLLALAPLAWLLWQTWHNRSNERVWARVCDERLLRHLLIPSGVRRGVRNTSYFALIGVLVIIALAGPTFERLAAPIFQHRGALVVALDLSHSMAAADIKPDRLSRAKFKVRDLFAQRTEGQTALIAFAAQPYVVTPLSSDVATSALQIPVLTPALMPQQGTNVGPTIDKAIDLLKHAGVVRGDILLVTDTASTEPLDAPLERLAAAGHRLSVLAVGTANGAPIPNQAGGFIADANGAIVIAKLDVKPLVDLARRGRGHFALLDPHSNADVQSLSNFFVEHANADAITRDDLVLEQWRELGPWLLLPAIALASLVFRRGILLLLLLVGTQQPLQAGWWMTPDQQAQSAYDRGDYAEAAAGFSDESWRAAAQYRAGDYADAAANYERLTGVEANYNRGNALAKLGAYERALEAYDAVLEANPEHADAKHNKSLLENLLKKKQQSEQSQQAGEKGQQDPQNGAQDDAERSNSAGEMQPTDQAQAETADNAGGDGQDDSRGDDSHAANSDPRLAAPQDPQHEQDAAETDAGEDDTLAAAEQDAEANGARDEMQLATEQWLNQIPDDPGGLLRRKFQYQYRLQQRDQPSSETPW